MGNKMLASLKMFYKDTKEIIYNNLKYWRNLDYKQN